jgi:hypothetical protein
MSKIIVGDARNIDGVRLTLEERLAYNFSPESMRDNYFVEMYGVKGIENDPSHKPFLGLIRQLTWAKNFAEKGKTVIVEQPEKGLSTLQKRIALLSILHLVYTGHDVVLDTQDKDFVSLVRLLGRIQKNEAGVDKLVEFLYVKVHERIWRQIFAEVLRNLHVELANNTVEETREVVL